MNILNGNGGKIVIINPINQYFNINFKEMEENAWEFSKNTSVPSLTLWISDTYKFSNFKNLRLEKNSENYVHILYDFKQPMQNWGFVCKEKKIYSDLKVYDKMWSFIHIRDTITNFARYSTNSENANKLMDAFFLNNSFKFIKGNEILPLEHDLVIDNIKQIIKYGNITVEYNENKRLKELGLLS